jgi:hypothetical protein
MEGKWLVKWTALTSSVLVIVSCAGTPAYEPMAPDPNAQAHGLSPFDIDTRTCEHRCLERFQRDDDVVKPICHNRCYQKASAARAQTTSDATTASPTPSVSAPVDDAAAKCKAGLAGLASHVTDDDVAAFQRVCVALAADSAVSPGCNKQLIPGSKDLVLPATSCVVNDDTRQRMLCEKVLYAVDYHNAPTEPPCRMTPFINAGEPGLRWCDNKTDATPSSSGFLVDHALSEVLRCSQTRTAREAARGDLTQRFAALMADRDKKNEWIKAHCKTTPNVWTSHKAVVATDGDGNGVQIDTNVAGTSIAFVDPPAACPKGTPADMNEYALGSLGHSPLRQQLRDVQQSQQADQRCQEHDAEVDSCRTMLAQPAP